MNITLQRAIKLALLTASLPALAQQTIELNPVQGLISENSDSDTETSKRFTIASMNSATGMNLSAKETPQTVSVITHQEMQDKNINTIADAMNTAVGIDVRNVDRGRSSFTARGFGISKLRTDGMDVSYSNQYTAGEGFADMSIYDHVEIVRGATGLLNGAGDPSASINLVRKHATSTTPKTSIMGSVGSYSNFGGSIDHSQALNQSGSVRGRFIANYDQGKTFVDWEKNKHLTLYGVIDADLTPTTSASAGISYEKLDRDSIMWGGLPVLYTDGTFTDWQRNKSTSTKWAYWNSHNTNYFAELKQKVGQTWTLSAKFNYAVNRGDSELFYFSGNSVDKNDPTNWNVSPGKFQTKRDQSNVQLEASGDYTLFNREHQLTLGFQRSWSHMDNHNYDYNAAPATNFLTWDGSYPEPEWTTRQHKAYWKELETGIYGATRINPTDSLHIIAGTRLANWKNSGSYYGSSRDFTAKNVWIPYAGIVYDLTPEHSLYASYTSVYKPQNYRTADNKQLDPVTGNNYEIGWKGSFLNDRLNTQASIYQMQQDNVAQKDGNKIVAGTQKEQAYYGAKGVKTRGFDLEVRGQITPEWQITGGYSQWQARDAKGEKVNTTQPRKQFKLFTTYDLQQMLPGLTVGGGVNWKSRTYTTTSNSATNGKVEYGQDSFALFNLMARYQVSPQFSAQLNVDNLFDKKYRNQMSFNQYNYGERRTITARFRYDF